VWPLPTLELCVRSEAVLPDCEESRFRVESIEGPCIWEESGKEAAGESMSIRCAGARRVGAFLAFALCNDSGLSGPAASVVLKLGFLECCRPLITEV